MTVSFRHHPTTIHTVIEEWSTRYPLTRSILPIRHSLKTIHYQHCWHLPSSYPTVGQVATGS